MYYVYSRLHCMCIVCTEDYIVSVLCVQKIVMYTYFVYSRSQSEHHFWNGKNLKTLLKHRYFSSRTLLLYYCKHRYFSSRTLLLYYCKHIFCLRRFWLSSLSSLVYLLPYTFRLFGFAMFWFWVYLIIVITETCPVH